MEKQQSKDPLHGSDPKTILEQLEPILVLILLASSYRLNVLLKIQV
jgi:hypothetical protein